MVQAVEKLPPHNLEAEQSVLGSLLIDRDAVIRVASFLKPDDFFRGAHGIVYQAILDLYNRREPPDFVTVVDELERRQRLEDVGGVAYLTELIDAVPTAVHVEYYGRIVERTATLRRLIDAGAEIIRVGHDESLEVDDALERSEQAVFDVSQRRTTRDFVSLGQILEQYFDKLDFIQQHRGNIVGVPTGFADLDKLTGGLQRSDLVILAARPSVGKTSLQLSIAHSAAVKHGKTVAIFSLEMSAEQLVQRLLSMETGVDSQRLRLGYIDDNEWDQISRAFGRLAEANIFIDDTASINVMELRSKARRLLAETGLDLVIVDYLQLVQGRRSENRVQEISDISRSLKGLARELNIPVLALSQLSRAVESRTDHRPLLSDLRESGCLAGETLIVDSVTGIPHRIDSLMERDAAQVWALNERLKMRPFTVSNAFPTGTKQLFDVCFTTGRRIQATANHPFRTVSGWIPLAELAPGATVATARFLPEPSAPRSMAEPELILLAYLLGDGCIVPRQPIHYTSADPACIEAVAGAAKEAFGITPRIVQQRNWSHVYLPSPTRLTHHRPHPITRWLRELGLDLRRSWEKQLPAAVFALSNDQLSLFLSHLWATDGNISRSRHTRCAIYYATTSQTLAEQLQLLLLRFGIVARIKMIDQRGYRTCYHVHIYGAQHQITFLNEIGCLGQRGQVIPELLAELSGIRTNPNVDIIPAEVWSKVRVAKDRMGIGWREVSRTIETAYGGSTLFKRGLSRERMGRVAAAVSDDELADLATSDVYWDRIVSVTPLGEASVFDLTVPNAHNFLANGIFVHNSIEQDADIVMFIYREDVYDHDTEKKGIAEVIVAKHRNGPTDTVHLRFFDRTARFADLELYRGPET